MRQVAIFLPSRSSNVSEDLDLDGCAAREQVADWLAYSLAEAGTDVHIFTNQEAPKHEWHYDENASFQYSYQRAQVHYVDSELAGPMLVNYEWDALVSFDFPAVASLPGIRDTVKKIVVAQNYAGVPPEGMADDETMALIDAVVYPSEWAAEHCSEANGYDPAKSVVIPYAADERFFIPSLTETKNSFIYANQAESGLPALLKMWPEIRAKLPDATLTVATPVEEFVNQIQWSHQLQAELALDIRDGMNQDGIRYIGKQGRPVMAKEFAKASTLLFPADPLNMSELGSLPMIQAAASGCSLLFRDVDALGELYGKASRIVQPNESFAEAVVSQSYGFVNLPRGREADRVAEDWNEFLADA